MPLLGSRALLLASVLLASAANPPTQGVLEEVSLPDLSVVAAEDECEAGRPGSESCALSALQRRTEKVSKTLAGAAGGEGCHDILKDEGGLCWDAMMWINYTGLPQHPSWYPGLNPATVTIPQLQFQAWNSTRPKCPRPCHVPVKALWCTHAAVPRLWRPSAAGGTVEVKVLSFNLFWWHLFKVEGGRDNSAGRLIQDNMDPQPFDVMGFQECEDPERVLGPVGLLDDFEAFQGTHAICMAYRKSAWTLVEKGEEDVAQDMRTEFYGTRGAQWMRLQNRKSGRFMFFVNHHGPLSVNSGGACGGAATANNLLRLMGTKAQVGDLLVLVGDFNANAGSRTIQGLWPHLQHVFNGDSFGGVDNIFSNIPNSAILATKILGSGGSDHDAITATVRAGPAPAGAPMPDLVVPTEECHDAVQGETCWDEVQWALDHGILDHPDWYRGLTPASSRHEFQRVVHEETPDKCPTPCTGEPPPEEDSVQPLPPPTHARSAVGEVMTEGFLEPSKSVRDLREARGSDGCLIEPNLQYVIAGGWTENRKDVVDARVCCRLCQGKTGCNSWTLAEWVTEVRGPSCQLHGGGHVVDKLSLDGFVSGLPKLQAVRYAKAVGQVP